VKRESDKIVAGLNRLVEACKDSQDGLRTAAENAQDPELQQLLKSYAGQRGNFAGQLQEEVRRHGGAPERSGTVAGTLHRGWINIKSTLLDPTDAAVIEECARGEETTIQEYEEVTREVLPPDVQQLLALQYKEIKAAHERFRNLNRNEDREP